MNCRNQQAVPGTSNVVGYVVSFGCQDRN